MNQELGKDGLLLIDKPVGVTSHQVVATVRKALGMQAVGHAGTLDPIASGLLVLLLGQATKLSDFVLNGDKGYRVQLRLGQITDTLDVTGDVLETRPVGLSDEEIQSAAASLSGPLQLPVPSFSAVKIKGRKLYEYARNAMAVELPVREMNFYEVDWLGRPQNDIVSFQLLCSKGSYVRSWAQRLGEILGCGAVVESLQRTFSAPYRLDQAMSLDGVGLAPLEKLSGFVPLDQCLPDWPGFSADRREAHLIRNGQIASSLRVRLLGQLRHSSGGKIVDSENQKLLALVLTDKVSNLNIRRVFH